MKDSMYRIGDLPSARQTVISINPNKKVDEAITLMLLNDFSQLPVMTNERNVEGIISWKTIGVRRQFSENEDLVKHCIDRVVVVEQSANFLEAVQIILEKEYVLVRERDNSICGIVTLADIGKQFLNHSEPFIEIEQIERSLRNIIDKAFSIEELKLFKNENDSTRSVESSSDLTFGECVRIFQNPAYWERIKLNVERVNFVNKLILINKIRNDVMHFKLDGLNYEDQEELKKMGKFLRTFNKVTNIHNPKVL